MNSKQDQDARMRAFTDRLERVTMRDFVNFLSAKGVTVTCPMCGQNDTQIIDETNHATLEDIVNEKQPRAFVTFFHHKPAMPGDSDSNYYYKMTCENCGYITMHGVTPVLRWLDSLESSGTEEEI